MSDYAQGFKDGFAAGLEEGKKLAPKKTRLDDYVFGSPNTCSVCKLTFDGPMGYVCSYPGCPSRVTCGTPMTGAVGNDISYSYGIGANGPDEKQYDARGWRIK